MSCVRTPLRRRVRAGALLFQLVALAGGIPAISQPIAPADASRVLQQVDDRYNRLSSLRCDFEEHFTGLGTERIESGTLLLSKPGRMRWTYATPAGKLFVLDGKYAWFYTPGSAQVQRVAAKQLDDLRSPLRFLLGRTRLERELVQVSVDTRPSGYRIRGVPRGMEQRVASLELEVQSSGLIDAIRVEERDGSVTQFNFRNVVENVPAPQESFRFHPPEGLPVVDALPPA